MNNILRVANLIFIYTAMFVGSFALSIFVGQIAKVKGWRSCPAAESLETGDRVAFLIGLMLSGWVFYGIFFPRVKRKSAVADEYDFVGDDDYSYKFCSTHPSYVLVDVWLLLVAYVMYTVGTTDTRGCYFLAEYYRGLTFLILSLSFPLVRLSAWFVLRRQIEDEKARKNAWKTLIPLYAILTPIFILTGFVYMQVIVMPQMKAPVADTVTLAGGLSQHPELEDPVVRLKGIQKSELFECKEFDGGKFSCATVLIDMGDGGEVLVRVCGLDQQDLVKKARGNTGKPFETFGKLKPLPKMNRDFLCGIEMLGVAPPAGRALLEIEYP